MSDNIDISDLPPPPSKDDISYLPSPPEDENGTRGLQKKAIGVATKIAEELPFGMGRQIAAGAMTLSNDRPYAENKKVVGDALDKVEEPAGVLGTVAGLATDLGAGGAEIQGTKRLLGLAREAPEASAILKAIQKSKMGYGERLNALLPKMAGSTVEGGIIGGIQGGAQSDRAEDIIPNIISGANAGSVLGAGAGIAGGILEDSSIAKKFNKAYKMGTEGDKTFGNVAKIRTGQEVLGNALYDNKGKLISGDPGTAMTVVGHMSSPLDTAAGIYDAELKRATGDGKVLPNTLGIIQTATDATQDLPKGEAGQYLTKLQAGTLNPEEGKQLYNIVNRYLRSANNNPAVNPSSIDRLTALKTELNKGIESTLPKDRLGKINQVFQGTRQGIETFLNDGIQNPHAQLESISDYNPGELKGRLTKKLINDTIPNSMRYNPAVSGDVLTTLSNYATTAEQQEGNLNKIIGDITKEEASGTLQNQGFKTPLTDKYLESKVNYNVPSSIRAIEDAGSRLAVTGQTSSHYKGENLGINKAQKMATGGAWDAIKSAPYDVANVVGTLSSPYKNIADKLEQTPFKAIGKAMNDAIANPGTNTKNAMLLKIMQNPEIRKTLGIHIKNKDQDEGNQ